MKTRKQAAAYYRDSGLGDTLNKQKEVVGEMAKRTGHQIVREYTDHSGGGHSAYCPGLNELIADAEAMASATSKPAKAAKCARTCQKASKPNSVATGRAARRAERGMLPNGV